MLSYAVNRFTIGLAPGAGLQLADRLLPGWSGAVSAPAGGLPGPDGVAQLFGSVFAPELMRACGARVRHQPHTPADLHFWQFPCITELAAWQVHRDQPARLDGDVLHAYLPIPWATWIDKLRRAPDMARPAVDHEMQLARVRMAGLRRALAEIGLTLRLHTVCQHIYWDDMLPRLRELGVTDLWLSHLRLGAATERNGLRLHPWSLYAVNVEDSARRTGIAIGRDPADKTLLASFIGAHMDHYPTDVRPRLLQLAAEPGFLVEVNGKWHFEDVVYGHQMGQAGLDAAYSVDATVERYNRTLSDSVFSLCPAGAGPNTLRLWESLAVGAIPVLIGPAPRLPEGGTLAPIDWDAIVLRVTRDEIPRLPERLRVMPLHERRQRQRLALDAYAQVITQRCF